MTAAWPPVCKLLGCRGGAGEGQSYAPLGSLLVAVLGVKADCAVAQQEYAYIYITSCLLATPWKPD